MISEAHSESFQTSKMEFCKIKPKGQRINIVTFYLRDISMPLVGLVFVQINRDVIKTAKMEF